MVFSMKKIAVVSGKGGVGKTTISLAMSRALAERYRVGLFDADITGANTHLNLDIIKNFEIKGDKIIPAMAELDGKKIEYMSIALVSDTYVKWKGDSVGEFIQQVIDKTNWNCEYLIIDGPPGTHSDAIKAIEISDIVVFVTIPTQFAYSDFEKVLKLVKDMKKPIAGVFLNFSSVKCPTCGNAFKLFENTFTYNIPVIQEIPFGDVRVDLDKLMKHLETPVVLMSKHSLKRELVKLFLRGIARWLP